MQPPSYFLPFSGAVGGFYNTPPFFMSLKKASTLIS
jgi:hypothetical protein